MLHHGTRGFGFLWSCESVPQYRSIAVRDWKTVCHFGRLSPGPLHSHGGTNDSDVPVIISIARAIDRSIRELLLDWR